MEYMDLIEMARRYYKDADASDVYEHIAIQVNVYGDIGGVFYIEIRDHNIYVEPYDYYDHDIAVSVDFYRAMAFYRGKIPTKEFIADKHVKIEGNLRKLYLMHKIVMPIEIDKVDERIYSI